MGINKNSYLALKQELDEKNVALVAVSKVQPVTSIHEMYGLGQRDFGENYVQELVEKQAQLPLDIHWHFIGHLQTNKVKFIAPFVHLVHGVDSLKLLKEINKQAAKVERTINCLLQVHVAREETKFGLNEEELVNILSEVNRLPRNFSNISIQGIMGMASFSSDEETIRGEFRYLKYLFDKYRTVVNPCCNFTILSLGMSGDYKMAVQEGSNMVRIGSMLFGARL